MNTTNILLITTSLLVVIAFTLSMGSFKGLSGTDDSEQEREELRQIIAQAKAEKAALEQASYYSTPPVLTSAPAPVAVATTQPEEAPKDLDAEQTAQIEALQKQLEEANAVAEKAEEKADFHKEEAGHFAKEKVREEQRAARAANRIRMAMVMGRVQEANTEFGVLTFVAENNMTFQPGQELGIRRQSGILGRVRVSREEAGQYVADILPNPFAGSLPDLVVASGDDLIKLPDDYTKPIGE